MGRWWVIGLLLIAACKSSGGDAGLGTLAEEPLATLAAPSVAVSPPASFTPPVTEVKVPKVLGLSATRARRLLEALGFDVTVKRMASGTRPGTVLAQSPKAGRRVEPGSLTLTVAKARPKPPPPAANCDPNYAGQCLDPNAYDYDCGGGSGDGPKYVYGTVRVVGYDHFGLDRDGDGYGCE
jgi:hypothetical protein